MKTREELNALKNEFEALNAKLAELTGEELEQVMGGIAHGRTYWKNRPGKNNDNDTSDDENSGEK